MGQRRARRGTDAEGLLFGRRTYEIFARRWPSRSGELAESLNSLPKYVLSSTLKDPGWNNSTVLPGNLVDEVSALEQKLDGETVLLGSIQLARTLLERGLFDELRLMIFPVVLGSGERLFGKTIDEKPMRLVDIKAIADGLALLTYQLVRDR